MMRQMFLLVPRQPIGKGKISRMVLLFIRLFADELFCSCSFRPSNSFFLPPKLGVTLKLNEVERVPFATKVSVETALVNLNLHVQDNTTCMYQST